MRNSPRHRALQALVIATSCLFVFAASVSAGDGAPKWASGLTAATTEMEKGNYGPAEKALMKLVQKYPTAAAIHTTLGKCFKRQGKLNEAKAEFRAAIEVEPNFAEAHYELGCMLESDKEYMGAAQSFETYLRLNPEASQRKTVTDRIRFCRSQ